MFAGQKRIDKFQNAIHNKLGYGVTRRGDRLTVRNTDKNGKLYQIEMVILEVSLEKDIYVPENK